MALRVSINLPGDTVITLEADEPGLWREVVDAVLKELPQGDPAPERQRSFPQGSLTYRQRRLRCQPRGGGSRARPRAPARCPDR